MSKYLEIVNFLYTEAMLLDERAFDDWLELLDDALVYRMPMRVTRDKEVGDDIVNDMTFFEETKRSLLTRVNRLKTTSAWAEDPPSRTRHFVSNILLQFETDDEVHVTSYFQLLKNRGSRMEVEQLFGKRSDVLRKVEGEWKLALRTIYPDQAVLSATNISSFL